MKNEPLSVKTLIFYSIMIITIFFIGYSNGFSLALNMATTDIHNTRVELEKCERYNELQNNDCKDAKLYVISGFMAGVTTCMEINEEIKASETNVHGDVSTISVNSSNPDAEENSEETDY